MIEYYRWGILWVGQAAAFAVSNFRSFVMRVRICVVALAVLVGFSGSAFAQLFSDDFDVDSSANWTTNNSANVDDPQSQPANYFFDYSTIGIPSAPNSVGGSTRGMKLQANMDYDSDGISGGSVVIGMSVSPTGLDLSAAGDFRLTADVWANYMTNTASGTSNLVTMGVGSNGTTANYPGGPSDALWFGSMTDGDTSSDYRVYGPERTISYQVPWLTTQAAPGVDFDATGKPIDSHAVYLAGTRANTGGAHVADFNGNGVVDAADYTRWKDWQGATGADATKAHGNADGNSCPDGVNNCGAGSAVVDGNDYTQWQTGFGGTPTLYTTTLPNAPAPPAEQIALFPQQGPSFDPGSSTPPSTALNPNQTGTIAFAWHEYKIDKIGNKVTWFIDGTPLISVDVTNTVKPLGGGNIMFGMTDQNATAPFDSNRFDLLFALYDNVKVTAIPSESGLGAAVGVPEPATLVLVAMGMVAFAAGRRR
jgi:hypothetical protein